MTTPHFDSDTKALKQREQCNMQGQLYDLENWIIQQTQIVQGMRILDLGCGTGKQMFAFANLVSASGSILGIDISDEAVSEVNKRAKKEPLDQVRAMKGSLDMCIDLLQGFRFDLILSTYAIYYARDMKRVLCDLKPLLNPNGQVFVSGPGRGTNQEIVNLINNVSGDSTGRAHPIDDFIQESEIKETARRYSNCKIARLFNQIRFDSSEHLLQWWKNHNSFIPEIHSAVRGSLQSYFAQNDYFVLTKNVLGVHYYA